MSELSNDPMRLALRAMTHGVYVLSLRHDDTDDYLIISLATQCSVQPPRIAFAVANESRILFALRSTASGVFSVLDTSQLAAVRRYGAPGGVKHVPDAPRRTVTPGAMGHPVPPEASHSIVFRIHGEVHGGDHVLFIADVVRAMPLHDEAASSGNAQRDGLQSRAPLTLRATGFPYAG